MPSNLNAFKQLYGSARLLERAPQPDAPQPEQATTPTPCLCLLLWPICPGCSLICSSLLCLARGTGVGLLPLHECGSGRADTLARCCNMSTETSPLNSHGAKVMTTPLSCLSLPTARQPCTLCSRSRLLARRFRSLRPCCASILYSLTSTSGANHLASRVTGIARRVMAAMRAGLHSAVLPVPHRHSLAPGTRGMCLTRCIRRVTTGRAVSCDLEQSAVTSGSQL